MANNASQWKVESVRCTAFPVQDSTFDPANWWVASTGSQPEVVTTKPSEEKYNAQGPKLNGTLQLQIEPLRIQWVLGSRSTEEEDDFRHIITVGDFSLIENFAHLVKKWFSEAPPLTRLAFGAVLLEEVNGRESGYRRLDKLLPDINIDVENSHDLLYQINYRRASNAVPGIEINRLSKWSVALISPMTIQIQSGEATVRSKSGDPISAVRLELDINNVPQSEFVISADSVEELFGELVSLGAEISAQGEMA